MPNDLKDRQDRRKPAIKLDEKQWIAVGQPNPAPALSLQHDQLLSERRDLRLEPRLRSDGRDQDGQNEPEKPDHPISLRDSPSPTTGSGFRYTQRTVFAQSGCFGAASYSHHQHAAAQPLGGLLRSPPARKMRSRYAAR